MGGQGMYCAVGGGDQQSQGLLAGRSRASQPAGTVHGEWPAAINHHTERIDSTGEFLHNYPAHE